MRLGRRRLVGLIWRTICPEHFSPPVVLLRNLEFPHRAQLASDEPDESVAFGLLEELFLRA